MRAMLTGLAALILYSLLFCGCEVKHEIKPSGKQVDIGVIVPLSGEKEAFGTKALYGLQAALTHHPLTHKGDRIVLHIEDNHSHTETTDTLLRKLAQNSDIKVIILLLNSNATLQITSLINHLEIPVIAALATHEDLTIKSSYLTRISSSNAAQGKIAAFFVSDELLLDKAALFYNPSSVYSSSLATFFIEEFEKIHREIVDVIESEMDENELERRLLLLKKAGVELVYTSAVDRNARRLLQLRKKLNLDFQILGTGNMQANLKAHSIIEMPQLSEDVFVVADYFDDKIKTDEEKKIVAYSEEKKIELTTHSYLAYESYLLLHNALGKCQECNQTQLNQLLRNNSGFTGISDVIRTVEGDAKRPMFINRIHDEKMHIYVKVY